ncbi:MAG: PAS domain-containing protein [Phycisphaerales bacterium]|nr:PAS domain-containing protein [Phycisphaerales bacterium]
MENRLTEQVEAPVQPTRSARRGVSLGVISVASAALVLGVIAASGWWTLRTHHRAGVDARRAQVELVGELMTQTCERTLGEGDLTAVLSGVRAMVAESAARYTLDECRIVLGDGTVLADSQASQISRSIPDAWPAIPGADGASAEEIDGRVVIRRPLKVTGKGDAVLELSADLDSELSQDSTAMYGSIAIALGGIGGLLALRRLMERRWKSLGAVGGVLRLAASGGGGRGSLRLSPSLGPEAAALNAIIEERDRLRDEGGIARCASELAAGSSAGSDLGGALEAMWQGVVVLGHDSRVIYANGAAGVLLGRPRGDAAGAPFSDLTDDEPLRAAAQAACSGLSRNRAELEVRRQASRGELTILRATVRHLPGERAAALVVVEDVTQQRMADESRNAFVAQTTHELRTPLTNIRLYVEALVDEGDDPAVRSKCLNVINTESRRLERIVGDMLSVAEIEAGVMKLHVAEARLDGVFEELEADYRALAHDKEITLAFELPPKLPALEVDRDKLMLALHNLLGNALKYTPAGGRVTVRVADDGPALRVDVVDSGIGIKAEEQELVFERFYRAKDKRIAGITGSGIGLALARQVIRLHGGDIGVRSEIDKGSTFTLTIPKPEAAARAAA